MRASVDDRALDSIDAVEFSIVVRRIRQVQGRVSRQAADLNQAFQDPVPLEDVANDVRAGNWTVRLGSQQFGLDGLCATIAEWLVAKVAAPPFTATIFLPEGESIGR